MDTLGRCGACPGSNEESFPPQDDPPGTLIGQSGGGTPSAGENVKARRRRRPLRQSRTCSLNTRTANEVESREPSVSQTTGAKKCSGRSVGACSVEERITFWNRCWNYQLLFQFFCDRHNQAMFLLHSKLMFHVIDAHQVQDRGMAGFFGGRRLIGFCFKFLMQNNVCI